VSHKNIVAILLCWPLAAAAAVAQTATDTRIDLLLHRALDNDVASLRSLDDYIYTETQTVQTFDKNGLPVKDKSTKTLEHFFIDGKPFERVLQTRGEDLSPGKAEDQERRITRSLEESKALTDTERQRRREKAEHELKDTIALRTDIVEGYVFTKTAEEPCGKDRCLRLTAEPKKGYVGRSSYRGVLHWMHGTVLVDEDAERWVDIEIRPIRQFGAGPVYVKADCDFHFVEQEVDKGVWAVTLAETRNDLRLTLYRENDNVRSVFSHFRKFRTKVELLEAHEASDQSDSSGPSLKVDGIPK
jgi:hypothetical protein